MLKGILLALAAFAMFLPLHVLVFHVGRPRARFRTMVALHAILTVSLLAAYVSTPADLGVLPPTRATGGAVIGSVNAVLVHWLLFMGYSMFYFLVDRGFSLRILIEIRQAPDGALSQAEVATVYPPESVVRRRLDEMVEIGRLTRDGDRYRLSARGRLDARIFGFVKKLFHFGPGG